MKSLIYKKKMYITFIYILISHLFASTEEVLVSQKNCLLLLFKIQSEKQKNCLRLCVCVCVYVNDFILELKVI